jgi:1,4-dihydroxy-2-naphthoyl-CoA hydrolase
MNHIDTIMAAQPFAGFLGMKITEASKERVVGELVVREELCTTGGTMHGGVMMGFCDVLGGSGAWIALPEGANGTTTVDSNTSFLSAPKVGVHITGVCTPVRIGRRVSVWQTDVTDETGKKVCLVTQTQLVL